LPDSPDRFPETVALRDGSRLVIRPVRPRDKSAIQEAFERMSSESRYRRFFSPLDRLTARDLAYLTEVDHHDHEALVGFDADSLEPVGAARYVRGAEPQEAEVAVAIVDHWQGRGAATAMLERLVERAREEGIRQFIALVMGDNRDALELFQHLAGTDGTTRRSATGNIELVIDIPESERLPGSGLGHALREAASGRLVANPWRVIRQRIASLRQGGAD
jgi:GNAT superfamily N-acetyltransferase